jgi:riboflavin synthase
MFTGIVQTKAVVSAFVGNDKFRTLTLDVGSEHLNNLTIGASIAINGVCLTVTHFEQESSTGLKSSTGSGGKSLTEEGHSTGIAQFDIIDETLEKTNLLKLDIGHHVNFERSVTFGTELGGHIVSGHIQTQAKITDIQTSTDNCKMTLILDERWMKYILHKGFVSVNGSSLTVGNTTENSFDLHLIPETLKLTNLSNAQVGDYLNIEVDQQTYTTVETVERYLKEHRN